MIFRRRRVRIELEENTLTLRLAKPIAAASSPQTTPAIADPLLPPASAAQPHLPAACEGNSTPEGTRHVR